MWLAAAVYFLGFSVIAHLYNNEILDIPRGIYWLFIYFAVGVMVFIAVAIGIVTVNNGSTPPANADYMIVLGSKCQNDKPTETLKYRLDGAIDYLTANEQTQVIVAGGQVGDETCTESSVMYRYLIHNGIDPERVIEEDQSKNTYENLTNSYDIIDDAKANVVIVTSAFHVYRACETAEDIGYKHVEGLGTPSDPLLIPYNYVREAAAVIKYRISAIGHQPEE